jgi:hypothetical protein
LIDTAYTSINDTAVGIRRVPAGGTVRKGTSERLVETADTVLWTSEVIAVGVWRVPAGKSVQVSTLLVWHD